MDFLGQKFLSDRSSCGIKVCAGRTFSSGRSLCRIKVCVRWWCQSGTRVENGWYSIIAILNITPDGINKLCGINGWIYSTKLIPNFLKQIFVACRIPAYSSFLPIPSPPTSSGKKRKKTLFMTNCTKNCFSSIQNWPTLFPCPSPIRGNPPFRLLLFFHTFVTFSTFLLILFFYTFFSSHPPTRTGWSR